VETLSWYYCQYWKVKAHFDGAIYLISPKSANVSDKDVLFAENISITVCFGPSFEDIL
jgi:hypothetical protein